MSAITLPPTLYTTWKIYPNISSPKNWNQDIKTLTQVPFLFEDLFVTPSFAYIRTPITFPDELGKIFNECKNLCMQQKFEEVISKIHQEARLDLLSSNNDIKNGQIKCYFLALKIISYAMMNEHDLEAINECTNLENEFKKQHLMLPTSLHYWAVSVRARCELRVGLYADAIEDAFNAMRSVATDRKEVANLLVTITLAQLLNGEIGKAQTSCVQIANWDSTHHLLPALKKHFQANL